MQTTHRLASLFIAAHEGTARHMLSKVGLRPSRQRIAMCGLLFAGEHRHIAADELHEEAKAHGIAMSLATVYNVLKQFDDVGLIRRIAVPGDRHYYDTNVGDHHHYFIAEEGRVVDMPVGDLLITNMPEPPQGRKISKIDIVVHLEPEARPVLDSKDK